MRRRRRNEMNKCEMSGVVLCFFGRPGQIHRPKGGAVDDDGRMEARIVINAYLCGVVLR